MSENFSLGKGGPADAPGQGRLGQTGLKDEELVRVEVRVGMFPRPTGGKELHENERLGLRALSLEDEYDTERHDIVADLYSPCLAVANTYDRAVGYFRASIYREMGESLLEFAMRGGKVRLVCSPDLPEPDELSARDGYSARGSRHQEPIDVDLCRVLQTMSEDPREADCLEMLRLLIENKSLELYVAVRPGGIYHRKVGHFQDEYRNSVVFSGSGNETASAVGIDGWGNDEQFDVYRSWGDSFERSKAEKKIVYLDRLFAGGTENTEVRPLTETERAVLERFRKYDSLEGARTGARARHPRPERKKPGAIHLYQYQKAAIEAWEHHSRVGLLAMATGLGKTFTALAAIAPLVREGTPILILVPSSALLHQWKPQVEQAYPEASLLLAGGGFDWRKSENKRLFVTRRAMPRIVLATMQTAASPEFREFFGQASQPALIADEVHRLGSPSFRQILDLQFGPRLGLSATPERLFDDEGNHALQEAFGREPVYTLDIGAKVRLGAESERPVPVLGRFLCPYYYDFEVVRLTSKEQEQWDELTKEVGPLSARSRQTKSKADAAWAKARMQSIFIERARITKQAAEKPATARNIIRARYPEDGRWIVYCDDSAQMNTVTAVLRQALPSTTIMEYHSGLTTEARKRVEEHFAEYPSIITAIRCLDEGVDIPRADGALILASSINPREYIQRRGRILRKAHGKARATVIDTIVLPSAGAADLSSDSLVRSELARAYEFAKHAVNQEVAHRLWKLCLEYNVNVETDIAGGIETEEELDDDD